MDEDRTTPSGAPAIEWTAREFIHYQKDSYWYIVAGIVALIVLAYSLVTKSVLSFIVFALLIALSYVAVHQKPRYLPVGLHGHGINIGDQFYKYTELATFWIVYEPPTVKTLNLKRKDGFLPIITVQLENQNPSEVRSFLLKVVPEEKEAPHETFSDRIMRWLKF